MKATVSIHIAISLINHRLWQTDELYNSTRDREARELMNKRRWFIGPKKWTFSSACDYLENNRTGAMAYYFYTKKRFDRILESFEKIPLDSMIELSWGSSGYLKIGGR
jgi:hypothetical protein